MSDEANVQVDPVEQNTGTNVPGEQAPEVNEIETRARAQGWVPKEEFRGPSEKWRDAAEFVKRGEEELPILRERSRTLERRIANMERQHQASYQRLERATTAAIERQRADLQARYDAALRDAVQTGDVQRFDQLRRDQHDAVADFDKRTREQVEQPQQRQGGNPPHIQAAVEQWIGGNDWFTLDPELNAVATAYHGRLSQEKPGLSISENLAEVTKYVRQRYPDKFGTTRTADPALVEGSGGRMASNGKVSLASKLSADERRIGDRYVKEGLFKNIEEYARELQSA